MQLTSLSVAGIKTVCFCSFSILAIFGAFLELSDVFSMMRDFAVFAPGSFSSQHIASFQIRDYTDFVEKDLIGGLGTVFSSTLISSWRRSTPSLRIDSFRCPSGNSKSSASSCLAGRVPPMRKFGCSSFRQNRWRNAPTDDFGGQVIFVTSV